MSSTGSAVFSIFRREFDPHLERYSITNSDHDNTTLYNIDSETLHMGLRGEARVLLDEDFERIGILSKRSCRARRTPLVAFEPAFAQTSRSSKRSR
jgi:hypothetical protein